jgi:hypothetical protein
MIFFDYFVLIMVAAFICRSWGATPRLLTPSEKRALEMFVVALILYYPASGLPVAGPFISLVARPIAVVLAILSFRLLVLTKLET